MCQELRAVGTAILAQPVHWRKDWCIRFSPAPVVESNRAVLIGKVVDNLGPRPGGASIMKKHQPWFTFASITDVDLNSIDFDFHETLVVAVSALKIKSMPLQGPRDLAAHVSALEWRSKDNVAHVRDIETRH
jgi:hypothetical protein